MSIRIADMAIEGHARIVVEQEEDRRARTLLVDKYAPRYAGDLSSWRAEALPVAVDLDTAGTPAA